MPLTLTFDPVTAKSTGVTKWSWPTSMPNMKTVGQRILKLFGGQAFEVNGPVTYTFDPVTWKALWVCWWSWLSPMPNMKTEGQRILVIDWADKSFIVKALLTLTFDLKINRSQLLVITNLNANYEDSWPKHSKAIELTIFLNYRPLWPWPWPSDFKIYKSHPHNQFYLTKLHAKYEDCGSMDS
jgi:hypothetical protein